MQGSDAKPAAKFQIQKSGLEGREGFEPSTPGFAASRSLVEPLGAVHYPAYSLQIPCLNGLREHHDGDIVSARGAAFFEATNSRFSLDNLRAGAIMPPLWVVQSHEEV